MAEVASDLTALYENSYSDEHHDAPIREISARDCLSHIRDVLDRAALGNVIDVGAGDGNLLALLNDEPSASRISGLEISANGLARMQARKLAKADRLERFDGYTMPFADHEFDTAICMHVIEHVEHERLFIRELARIARRIVIEVPIEGGLRLERSIAASGPGGHINFYTPESFLSLLRTCGLKPIRSTVGTPSVQYETQLYGARKGRLRNALRRGALMLFPRLAPHALAYVITVYCEVGA